jgi:hypothetical protein
MNKGLMGLAAGVLALAAMEAGAQDAYKCSTRDGVVYSQLPCPGGRAVGAPRKAASERNAVPPQDRAHRVQRASLPPEKREECNALDTTLADEKATLAKLPQPPTPAEEKGLLNAKMRYRKLHC